MLEKKKQCKIKRLLPNNRKRQILLPLILSLILQDDNVLTLSFNFVIEYPLNINLQPAERHLS